MITLFSTINLANTNDGPKKSNLAHYNYKKTPCTLLTLYTCIVDLSVLRLTLKQMYDTMYLKVEAIYTTMVYSHYRGAFTQPWCIHTTLVSLATRLFAPWAQTLSGMCPKQCLMVRVSMNVEIMMMHH